MWLRHRRWDLWVASCILCDHRTKNYVKDIVCVIYCALQMQVDTEFVKYGRDTRGGKDGRCVGLTTLPSSCADGIEILGSLTSLNPNGLSRDIFNLFTFTFLYIHVCKRQKYTCNARVHAAKAYRGRRRIHPLILNVIAVSGQRLVPAHRTVIK
jgi:hypothetical protein